MSSFRPRAAWPGPDPSRWRWRCARSPLDYDGQRIAIHHGERLTLDHPIVREAPQYFRVITALKRKTRPPAGWRGRLGVRSRTSSSGTDRHGACPDRKKPDPERIYFAVEGFASTGLQIARGERRRGDDPVVIEHFDLLHRHEPPDEIHVVALAELPPPAPGRVLALVVEADPRHPAPPPTPSRASTATPGAD